MIWLHRQGPIQPVGSSTGTATVAGEQYDVWVGNNGENDVVPYLRLGSQGGTTSFKADLMAFVRDTVSRGRAQDSWFLNGVQLGFEPWSGGAGLAVDSFTLAKGQ